jgi:cytosine/adenosine deaminase-related metal-dependent hydrolase
VLRVRARAVHPVTAPPIPDGAVLVDDAGRIAAVGPDLLVPTPPGAERLAFPEAVVVPGLVNCHTHLELAGLGGRVVEPDFVHWIRRIRERKDAAPWDTLRRGAEQGVRDAWAAGVTCVADTGSSGAAMAALAALGGRGVAFQEVFGPDPARCEESLADLAGAVARLRPLASDRLRLGVSPHAPYTVSAPLYRAVDELARRESLPLAMHLAESPEEVRLVHDGAGPFADALRARGIPVEPRGVSPVRYLAQLGLLRPECLCIHCVQVDAADVRFIAAGGAAVAHCPRSNAAHHHGTAPAAALRAAGVRVGLGTDSVASTGAVSLCDEAPAAGLGGAAALRALTLDGARALGLDGEIGSLEVGKQADLAVFPSPPGAAGRDGPAAAVVTIVAGRVVHR